MIAKYGLNDYLWENTIFFNNNRHNLCLIVDSQMDPRSSKHISLYILIINLGITG